MAEEKLDDIIDATVESVVDEGTKTEQTTGHVEEGTSGENPQKDKGGWYTSIPKEFRETASKYGSMSEYLTALNGNDQKSEPEGKPEEESWEDYLEGIKRSEESAGEDPMLSILKESGVSVESSKKVLESTRRLKDKAMADAKKGLGKAMHEIWGDDYEVNTAAVQRGISAIGNKNMVKSMYDTGLMYNPAVLHLVSMVGRANSEVVPPVGAHVASKDKFDPNNPLGF